MTQAILDDDLDLADLLVVFDTISPESIHQWRLAPSFINIDNGIHML